MPGNSDPSGVFGVDVAIVNSSTQLTLQSDGAWRTLALGSDGLPASIDVGVTATNWSVTVPDLPIGIYTVLVRARDGTGSMHLWYVDSLRIAPVYVGYETGKPALTADFVAGENLPMVDGQWVLSGTASDPSGVFGVDVAIVDRATQLTLQSDGTWRMMTGAVGTDGVAASIDVGATATDWSVTVPDLPAGSYTVLVRARDLFYNMHFWYGDSIRITPVFA